MLMIVLPHQKRALLFLLCDSDSMVVITTFNTVEVVPFIRFDVPEPINVASSSNGWVVNLSWDSPDLPEVSCSF